MSVLRNNVGLVSVDAIDRDVCASQDQLPARCPDFPEVALMQRLCSATLCFSGPFLFGCKLFHEATVAIYFIAISRFGSPERQLGALFI